MGFGIDVKKLLHDKVCERISTYEGETRIITRYGEPLVGYVSAEHPLFDDFYLRRQCLHPKKIFRPGCMVIVYFVPFAKEIAESNRGGEQVSEAWNRAMSDSIMLQAHINGVLRETLTELGRNTSGTNLPGDWDEELFRPCWSHKHAAFLAGMGEFGTAGSFHTEKGFAGCFGSVITDLPLEPSKVWCEDELIQRDALCDAIERTYTAGLSGKITLCPAGAISLDTINKTTCAAFCRNQDQPAPLPDVCGKCFFF